METIKGAALDQLPLILAFLIGSYVTRPFVFDTIELTLQHFADNVPSFRDLLFEAITTGEIMYDEPAQKANFYAFIKKFIDLNLFSSDEWRTRLEPETLKELNLITDCALFNRKSVRQNTALVYKQVKFNLLRESNMGYAFLLVKLSSAIKNQAPSEQIVELVSLYIGSYNLELVRVVDFILTLFELNVETQYDYFLNLLSNCPWYQPEEQDDQKSGVQLYSSVLGFRFSCALGSASPKLYHVAALMVKHNLAKLELFYFQLGPSIDDWKTIYQEHIKGLRNRRHAIASALGEMASDLEGGDTKSSLADPSLAKNNLEEKQKSENQRVGLLNALLSIGAYHDSMWILLRQREFLGYDDDCASLTCRLILELLNFQGEYHSKSFAPVVLAGLDAPSVSANRIKRIYSVLSPLHLQPDQVFYYSEWREEINRELADQVFYWLKLLGPNVRDNALFARLASMAREPLKSDKASAEYIQWSEILRGSLFPSLLVCGGNEGNHNMLWDTLSALPLKERYSFYDDWVYGRNSDTEEVKALLYSGRIVANQLTARTTSQNSRYFGILYKTELLRCPGVVFLAILKPIMRYGQTTQYIEVFRFLTKLSADMFHFVLLDLCSDPTQRGINQSGRLKNDCTNVEGWLRNLAQFISYLCRKYSFFSIHTILTYVTNQLHAGNPYDLVFLSELLIKLGGLETHDNLTDLHSLTGGRALKAEAYPQDIPLRATASSAGRLADALVNSRLLPVLMVLLARQQQSVIFSNDISPYTSDSVILEGNLVPGLLPQFIRANKGALSLPKVLASHTDTVHEVLLRVMELIEGYIDPIKLADLLPTLTQFCAEFGVDTALAFGFLRPHLAYLATRDMQAPPPVVTEMEQGELMEDIEPTQEIWLPSLQPFAREFQTLFPSLTSNGIRPEFFITFWQLRMYDVLVPKEKYRNHINALKAPRPQERGSEAQGDRKIYDQRIALLEKELTNQVAVHNLCLERLKREKEHWFDVTVDLNSLSAQLVENCILQRCTFSSLDALFCARFLLMLHEQNTPGFSLILAVDNILVYFRKMLFLCTATEARHFGLFLSELFKPLTKWHHDPAAFEAEAHSIAPIGISTKQSRARVLFQEKADLLKGQSFSAHELFCFQVMDWNREILDAAVKCLESCEYMQTHSAFSVLAEMGESFPLIKEHNSTLLQHIEILVSNKEMKMDSIALGYKAKLLKYQERCVSASTFSKIDGILFRPPPEEPKPGHASSPNLRPSNLRPSRHRLEQERHSRNSPPLSQKRQRPETSGDARNRLSRESDHSHSIQRVSLNRERSGRHDQPRDSGRDSMRDRRPMPTSSRDGLSQRDIRGHYGQERNTSFRSSPPFKRHRNDYDQPMLYSHRGPSPPDSRGPRQRVEHTLSSVSGDGFGGDRVTRRGGMQPQIGRRMMPGNAANAHLQDNNLDRRYHR
ncbi:THO complex subunit 2 [Massospora cicadina]|nr:THO complex subunit 2 [Massospora cicadina]